MRLWGRITFLGLWPRVFEYDMSHCKLPVNSLPHCLAQLMCEVSVCPGVTMQQDKHVIALGQLFQSLSPLERREPFLDLLSHSTSSFVVAANIKMIAAASANFSKHDWIRGTLSCQSLNNLALKVGELRVGCVVTATPPQGSQRERRLREAR